MISLKHGFLFVHIPKTAGNSIQSVLLDYSEDETFCRTPRQDGIERFAIKSKLPNIEKHSTLQEYRAQLGEETFQKLFKFTCVRNPWDRMISTYFSRHRWSNSWNKKRFIQLLKVTPPMESYISLKNTNTFEERHIDSYIRYEHLNDDFELVCDRIGIPFTQLPRRNSSGHHNYAVYYDDGLVELVKKKFSVEIKYFGYAFDGNA